MADETKESASPPAQSGGSEPTPAPAQPDAPPAEPAKPAPAPAQPAPAPAPAQPDEMASRIAALSERIESLQKRLDEAQAKAADAQKAKASEEIAAARAAFVAEKLAGVPAIYAAGLGDDPAAWAAQEAEIRARYQADLKAAGFVAPDVSGDAGGEAAAKKTVVTIGAGTTLPEGLAAFAASMKK